MEDVDRKIAEAYDWLIRDQYPYGEWGRCEATDPTEDFRNLEASRIKPKIFTSSQAMLALLATGFERPEAYNHFFQWLHALRNEDGYWTSASGSKIPSGKERGWSEVKNLRHTAKGIDILILRGEFAPVDASIIHTILGSQCENGAFSQYPGSAPDVWSTAYAMNMILRCMQPANLPMSVPRRNSSEDWVVKLRSQLDGARAWLCSQVSDQGAWSVDQKDSLWITEALLSEIGGDLSIHRPDLCAKVSDFLLERATPRRAVAIWALLLVLQALRPEQQRQVLILVGEACKQELPSETLEVSSFLKVLWLSQNPHMLSYYVHDAIGHESTLTRWTGWDQTEYAKWCVDKAAKEINEGNIRLQANPGNKAEAWVSVMHLLSTFKFQIEESRGWELLWNDGEEPRNEQSAQIAFWNIARPLAEGRGILVREPDTGAGPVDFSFSNGLRALIHLEFKLASSSKLKHGIAVQLPSYMVAASVDSALYVVVGYSENDKKVYDRLVGTVEDLKHENPQIFIALMYVDARRRESASRR